MKTLIVDSEFTSAAFKEDSDVEMTSSGLDIYADKQRLVSLAGGDDLSIAYGRDVQSANIWLPPEAHVNIRLGTGDLKIRLTPKFERSTGPGDVEVQLEVLDADERVILSSLLNAQTFG